MRLGPVLIGIDGVKLTLESRERLAHRLVGGVVLFTRNFESRAQLADLVQDLRDLREPRLLLAVDQEGGRVQRFREGFTKLPALGRIGEQRRARPGNAADYAYWHGRVMATEMLQAGIDLSFAPVLDLDRGSDVIGDRALCSEPEGVIELGRAYIKGMHDAGMKTTGKHFPGHGSVKADSHVADVCDDRAFDEIDSSDLQPFSELAADLDALMIAHVIYTCLDEKPAGYSAAWLGEQLRRRIGFEGVIFSDDLGMHAAKSLGNLAHRTRAALAAGCEAVLVCRPEDVAALNEEWQEGFEWRDPTPRLRSLYGLPDRAMTGDTVALSQWKARLEQLC